MTSFELFRRVRNAYDRVLDAPEQERAGVIEAIAVDHPDVHVELMRILTHHESHDGILDLPIARAGSSDSWRVFPVASYREDLQACAAPDCAPAAGSEAPPPQIGPYALLDVLGEGGMGVVYRARDTRNGDEVALKMLQHVSPGAVARFKRESRLVTHIAHRNIVTLYELLSDGQRWCLTMELVRGHSFLRHLAAVAPRERLVRLRKLLGQLAHALVTLHDAKVIHRDIKPSNVLVTADGRLVLLDFGLAAPLDDRGLYRSTADHLVGTIPYLSPEHASGTAVSFASDWYSLGVMVYEALAGCHPFVGAPAAILDAKRTEDPRPPSAFAAGVPPDLELLCLELLRRDPAERPTGAEILRRLDAGATPVPGGSLQGGAESAFVGRQHELESLADAYQTTRAGRSVIVYLRGESGAGKSALLQRFVDQLRHAHPDAVILIGRCYEHESVPFKALDSLVDAIARFFGELPDELAAALLPRDVRALARLFPVLRQVKGVREAPSVGSDSSDPQELRRRAAGALREILARLGDRYPLVLAVDDLQWGDADSARVLTDILTPPDPPVFLGIGCCRTEDIDHSPFFTQLRELRAGTVVPHEERDVVVEPLVAEDTRLLTRQLLGTASLASDATTEAIVRESGGRPLLVRELVEHVTRGRDVAAFGGTVTLDAALWSRIGQLPADVRLLLEVLAVAGRPIPLTVAAQALPAPVDQRAALMLLRDRRLVRGPAVADGDLIEAYHDQVRECVLGHMEPAVRRDHHRRLAQTFQRRSTPDHEVLARHFHGAEDFATAAIHYAQAAATAAQSLAFDHSARLYRHALTFGAWPEDERRRLRAALGDALANAGRGAEAATEFVAAAEGAEPMQRLDLQRRAALQLLTSGHVDEGVARLAPVLRAFGLKVAGSPWRSLLWLLARRTRLRLRGLEFVERAETAIAPHELLRIDASWSAVIGLSLIDPIRGADFQAQNLLLALEVGEPFRVARALAVEAGHLGSSGDLAGATMVLTQAERLAREMNRPYANAIIELARATTAYFAQRWRDALAAAGRAEAIFREQCNGVAWEIDTASAFSLWSMAKLGELAMLSRVCHPLLKEAIERGDLYAATNLSTQIMTFVRIAANDPDGARDDLESAIARWSQNGYHVQHHDALHAFVPLELYADRAPAAWDRVEAEWSAFKWSLLSQIQDVRIEMRQLHGYCALAMAAARRDNAPYLAAAAADARRLRRERLRWTDGHADYIDAAIAFHRGRSADAIARLAAAVEAFDDVEANLYAAVTRRRLAALVGGSTGLALTRSADEWFRAQGIVDPARMAMAFAPGFPP